MKGNGQDMGRKQGKAQLVFTWWLLLVSRKFYIVYFLINEKLKTVTFVVDL